MQDVQYDAVLLREDVVKVLITGELDMYTAPAFRDYLLEQIADEARRHLFLDMRGVPYYDSTALGATVRVRKELLRREGQVVVRGNEHVMNVLRITGLSKLMTLVDSDEAALAELGPLEAAVPDGEVA